MKTRKAKVKYYRSGILRINWKWRFKSGNGRILAHGAGFNTRSSCIRSFEKLKLLLQDHEIEQ